jgi:hypothetical protein
MHMHMHMHIHVHVHVHVHVCPQALPTCTHGDRPDKLVTWIWDEDLYARTPPLPPPPLGPRLSDVTAPRLTPAAPGLRWRRTEIESGTPLTQ